MRKQYDESKKGLKAASRQGREAAARRRTAARRDEMVKVFIAVKRKIPARRQDGGAFTCNKGVVSADVPQEDMPFLEDGTRSTSCSNPLAGRAG